MDKTGRNVPVLMAACREKGIQEIKSDRLCRNSHPL